MLNAKKTFQDGIKAARDQGSLYRFLKQSVPAPFPYDDLLRYQVVHSVSAFDKLMHDIIRKGMVATFSGTRGATPRYNGESITIQLHSNLISATFPPREVLFEQEVSRKLSHLSFQDPDKVAEGLSLIWSEKHKWQAIAGRMGLDREGVVTKLKLIVSRRNGIVHEADLDPVTEAKIPITDVEADDISGFIETCGVAICDLVI